VGSYNYSPDGAFPYGDALDEGYADSPGTWPEQYGDSGQYSDPGQYSGPGQPEYPYHQVNGGPQWARPAVVDPWQEARRGYPPRRSWPMPMDGGGSGQAYVPRTQDPRAYSGPMPAYRPDGYGPGSGPMRAYRPEGDSPAYRQRSATTLLTDNPSVSGPMPAFRRSRGMTTTEDLLPPARGDALSGGKVLEWLPFGNRIVLLPKDVEEKLREHRDVNGGWLRPAVFGAMDGLVTNSSLIAGIGAGGGGPGMIVLTGIAGLIAGAFSMATGEYISVKSQNELNLAEVELERKQHACDPKGKRARLSQIYMDKGVSPNLAEAVARQISADQERAVTTHAREDLGIDPDDLPSPRTAAIASLASFTVGALIPLAPFLVGFPSLSAALEVAGAAAFIGGAAVARLTGRSMLLGGVRQFTAAFLGTGMSFLVGHLIGAGS
jgi:vacuolar iron transporter family protein